MRKLLFWLLVIATPLLGLVLGAQCSPANKPLWVRWMHRICIVGFVDEGKTLLYIEDLNQKNTRQLIGVDVETGREKHRQHLADEFVNIELNTYRPFVISSDYKHLFCVGIGPQKGQKSGNGIPQVLKYDWKNRKVVQRFQMSDDKKQDINRIGLITSQKKLIAINDYSGTLTFWNLETPDTLPVSLPMDEHYYRYHVSDDGIYICALRCNREKTISTMQIKELSTGRLILQQEFEFIPTILEFSDVDRLVMVAAERSTAFNAFNIDEYHRNKDCFELQHEKTTSLRALGYTKVWGNATALIDTPYHYGWERRLLDWLGPARYTQWKRFIPSVKRVFIYDPETQQRLHTLHLPWNHWFDGRFQFKVSPCGNAVAISDMHHLEYWSLGATVSSRYLPVIGLFLGLAFSCALMLMYWGKPWGLSPWFLTAKARANRLIPL